MSARVLNSSHFGVAETLGLPAVTLDGFITLTRLVADAEGGSLPFVQAAAGAWCIARGVLDALVGGAEGARWTALKAHTASLLSAAFPASSKAAGSSGALPCFATTPSGECTGVLGSQLITAAGADLAPFTSSAAEAAALAGMLVRVQALLARMLHGIEGAMQALAGMPLHLPEAAASPAPTAASWAPPSPEEATAIVLDDATVLLQPLRSMPPRLSSVVCAHLR